MEEIKTQKLTGTFDFPIDVPFIIRSLPDGKVGFEIVPPTIFVDTFLKLLEETPDCNDFRRLGSGEWMAYSTVMEEENENNLAVRASGATILYALKNLRVRLGSTI